MNRTAIINTIGIEYHTPNIEAGEYSYVLEAGSKVELEKKTLVVLFRIINLI